MPVKGSEKKTWRLNQADVGWGMSTSRTGRGGAIEMTLTHLPTGLSESGGVPGGRYSRGEMSILRDKLFAVLYHRLELAVARHLRIPGRIE